MTSGGEPRDTADGGTPDASAPRAEADVTRVRPRFVWLLTAGTIALAACIVIEIVTSTGSIPTVRDQLVALAALLALKTPLAWRALSGLPRLSSWARSRDLSRNALARACVFPGAVFVAGRLIASSPPWIEHLALLTAFLCVLVVDALPGRVLKSAGAVAGLLGSLIVIWAFDFDARVAPIGVDSFQAGFQTDPRESWQFVAAHADRQLAQLLTALLVAHAMLLGQRMVAAQRGDRDRLTRQVIALAAAALLVLASGQLAARALSLAGNLRASIADFRAQRDLFLASRAQFDQPAANLSAPATPTDLVVYIGESTTRHHMSVYGYPRNTTPFLVSAQSDLIVFANATAPHSHIVRSLVEMLTDLNFDGSAGLQRTAKHAQAAGAAPFVLIDVLNASGVPSWWFSNHNQFGLWDNPVANLGMRADHTKFYRTSVGSGFATVSYDDAMIEDATALLRRDDPGSRAIFLHSYAGHEDYCKNIPPPWRNAFSGFGVPPLAYFGKAPANQARVDCYDAAIRCIDDYLRRVVEAARASRRQTILIYVADHGEDVDNGSYRRSQVFLIPMASAYSWGTRVRSTHTNDSWDRKASGRAAGSPGRVRRWAVTRRRKASMDLRSAALAAHSNVTRIAESLTVTWPGAASKLASSFFASRGRCMYRASVQARSLSAFAQAVRIVSSSSLYSGAWWTSLPASSVLHSWSCSGTCGRCASSSSC